MLLELVPARRQTKRMANLMQCEGIKKSSVPAGAGVV
jgi:hypothetical protein